MFQPHRYSRTQRLRDEFGVSFDGIDELYVTDIYPASELPIDGVTGATVVEGPELARRVGRRLLRTFGAAPGDETIAGEETP